MNSRFMSIVSIIISFFTLGYVVYFQSLNDQVSSTSYVTKDQIPSLIKSTLENEPEITINSIEKYREEKMKEMVEAQNKKIAELAPKIEKNTTDPRAGAKNAKVKIIDFFDYNCGHCRQMEKVKDELLQNNPDVEIIYKELPIMSQDSLSLTMASLAVYKIAPDKYLAFQNSLFTTPSASQNIMKIAAALGIDTDQLKKEMSSPSIKNQIENNMNVAREVGLQGTPFYIVGGKAIRGSTTLAELQKAVDEARATTPSDKESSASSAELKPVDKTNIESSNSVKQGEKPTEETASSAKAA